MVEETTSKSSDLEAQIKKLETEKALLERSSYIDAQQNSQSRGERRLCRKDFKVTNKRVSFVFLKQ